jgi:putative FmdB family regulatory protein
MPIYAYKCESCGHRRDVLQKISDPVLSICPACGASAFAKQITAAGFQLKGSGWYATDFRGGNTAPAEPAAAAKKDDGGGSGSSSTGGGTGGGSAPAAGGSTPSSSAAAGGCGASCACH